MLDTDTKRRIDTARDILVDKVGLTGEVRAVSRPELRVKEAAPRQEGDDGYAVTLCDRSMSESKPHAL